MVFLRLLMAGRPARKANARNITDQAVLDSLVTRLERANPDCARRWGTMNVHQMLADAHPFFGRMSRGDWLRYACLHTDHHLRRFGL